MFLQKREEEDPQKLQKKVLTYSSLPNNCAAKTYSFLRIFIPTRPYSILHVY